MNKIVLASGSPRRSELLQKYQIPFVVDFIETVEVLDDNLALLPRLEKVVLEKARVMVDKYPHDTILAGDTVVCFNEILLGKPTSRAHAKEMLQSFSGNKQTVYTAVAIIKSCKETVFVESCDVYFKEISDTMIEDYLDTNEWVDKAGAYGIQGSAGDFIDRIEGNIETVIGFPVYKISKLL